MRLNDLNLGYNPVRTPLFSMDVNKLAVEGVDTSVWPRGAGVAQVPVTIYVKDTVGTGGNAVGSQAATEALCRQAEELVQNRELNHPAYIKWNENRDVPHDGWYVVTKFQPDYRTTQSGTIKVTAEVQYVAPGSTYRIGIWHSGGATAAGAAYPYYIDTPVQWVPMPLNSTPLGQGFTRTGAEGAVQIVTNPLTPVVGLVPGPSQPDLFKGGVRVFDTMAVGGNPIPAYMLTDGFEGNFNGTFKNLWKSLGTDATGTLTFWTQLAGVWSIAANVASITGSGQMQGGHAEWSDIVYTARVQCPAAGTNAEALVRSVDANNFVGAYINTTTFGLEKTIAGVNTSVNTAASAQTAGTYYWIVVIVIGTSYRADLYADSAGVIQNSPGSSLATVSGTISDAAVQTAKVGLRSNGAAACNFGGAFAGVLNVQGMGPWGWTPYIFSGEPAFAWSTSQFHSGTSSASISCLAACNAGWQMSPLPLLAVPYQYSIWGKGGTTGILYLNDNINQAVSLNAPLAAWTQSVAPLTPTQGTKQFLVQFNGTGTVYFDDASIQTATAPGGYVPSSWVEVKDRKHRFVGDMVITNGLVAEVFQAGSAIVAQPSVFYWDTVATTPGWRYVASLGMQDNSGNAGGLYSWRLVRVGFLDAVVECDYYSTVTGQGALFSHRVLAGSPFVTFDLKPRGWNSTNKNLLVVNALYPGKVFAVDNGFADTGLPTFQAGYGQYFGSTTWWTPSPAMPALVSLLYQTTPPTNQQGNIVSGNLIGIGDTPNSNSVTRYGFAVVPFSGVTTLQTKGELSGVGAPWVPTPWVPLVTPTNAAATRSGAMKLPSGTATAQTYTIATLTNLGGSSLQISFRRRVTSQASATLQFRFQVYDVTSATVLDSVDQSPLNITTNFLMSSFPTAATVGLAIPAGHTIALQIVTLALTTTDLLLDNVTVRPLSLPGTGYGMQAIWDQFQADDTRRLEVAA